MKYKSNTTYLFASIIIINILCAIPTVKAESSIPSNFNKDLDLNEVYIYNVSSFNTTKRLEWLPLDWTAPPKGYANTSKGGQISVNFTGFYQKDPYDFFNLFGNPMPYMDIEFLENRSGILVSNATFLNVSNGEAALNLLLGYNMFKSGFLIPINDFNNLTQQAYAQDQPPFMNATITVQQTSETISIDFKQKTFLQQKTFLIYDKISGLLIYTNTSFGNFTLEMTLINKPNFPSGNLGIPSFNFSIIMSFLVIITLSILLKLHMKRTKRIL
ncbi:MAG: hypothetical protein ACFFEN_05895 [Candidatus Thorarchaeota archaeon]